jgi:hypothetical protein
MPFSQIRYSERFVTLGYSGNDAERRAEWFEWRSSPGREWTRRRAKPWKGQGKRRRCSVRSTVDLPGSKSLMHRFRALMYSHSPERNRVDVVDLDPYGTAAPFIDAAVQCITDGGGPI